MKQKRQVVVVHGGESFRSRGEYISFLKKLRIDLARYRGARRKNWKGTLAAALGGRFEVIAPDMPNKLNAQYEEWEIWFQKFVPHLRRGVILVGHSLGATFLAQYLAERKFPKKIRGTFLVAPVLAAGSFRPPGNLARLAREGGKIFLYASKDDRVVPFAHFEAYCRRLPGATAHVFRNRGHFNQARFPELARDVRSLVSL